MIHALITHDVAHRRRTGGDLWSNAARRRRPVSCSHVIERVDAHQGLAEPSDVVLCELLEEGEELLELLGESLDC